MKRLIVIMLIAAAGIGNMQAQEIYTEVLNMAKERVNDPTSSNLIREINQFKVNALTYMALKMREDMPDESAEVLDAEAYGLYSFVDLYVQTLYKNSNEAPAYQRQLIGIFLEASLSTPLFNDADKETVYIYTNKEDAFIRFALDTNWVKALEIVKEKLKE